jgi:hypothetical protein
MSKETQNSELSTDKALHIGSVSKRFLFQYRSVDQELMVELQANSLNDAMVYFATRYHQIEEVYEIAEVS